MIFVHHAERLDAAFGLQGGTGFYADMGRKYFYFAYHLGIFPITTPCVEAIRWNDPGWARALLAGPPEISRAGPCTDGAGRASPRLGRPGTWGRLVMEDYWYLRTGDLGKLWLLYPYAWLHRTTERASLLPFNRALGIVSLVALFVAFALCGHRLLGAALVLVLGSHPFVLHELLASNNVFGYAIPVASLLLALHAPLLLLGRLPRAAWLLPLVSGCFLATVREVRTEPMLVIASVAMLYLFAPTSWPRRGALLGLLFVAFFATGWGWSLHWSQRFSEARRAVEAAGGVVFDGPLGRHHSLWHPLWCGLGDFDTQHGYSWDDRTAYEFAIPEINRRFGTEYSRQPPNYMLDQYYTDARKHRIKPESLPEYSTVLRDKILSDIRGDPAWYAGILGRRLQRIFSQATPLRLGIGTAHLDLPWSAWLFLPVLAWLAWLGCWRQVQLLCFYLPASATSLLVYSAQGWTHGSAFHLVPFALLICWLAHLPERCRETVSSQPRTAEGSPT